MKAVNLIPPDARRSGSTGALAARAPVYAIIGVLAAGVVLVTFYVLTRNTVADRQAKLTTLEAQLTRARAQAAQLANYVQFAQLAQTRAQSVRQIAASRFDWRAALSDLAKVVPANTSLQSLVGSVSPQSGGTGLAGGATAAGLRSTSSAPALELTGCTTTQDDVARLLSRLRVMNGVGRVTLGDTQKSEGPQPGASVAATTSSRLASGTSQGCRPNSPTFDLVVFFAAGAGASAK